MCRWCETKMNNLLTIINKVLKKVIFKSNLYKNRLIMDKYESNMYNIKRNL